MGGDGVLYYDEANGGVLEVYRDVRATGKTNISTNDEQALIIGDKEDNYWEFGNSYATFKDSSDDVLLEVDSDGWIYTPYVGTNTLSSRNEGRIIVSNTLNMEDDIDMQGDYSVKNVSEISFADGTSMTTAGGGAGPLYEHAFMIYSLQSFKGYIRLYKEDDTPFASSAELAAWLKAQSTVYGDRYRLPIYTGMYLSGSTLLPLFYVYATTNVTGSLTFGYGNAQLQNATFNSSNANITNYSIRKIF